MKQTIKQPASSHLWLRLVKRVALTVGWFGVALLCVWSLAALYIDIRVDIVRLPVAIVFAAAILIALTTQKAVHAALICLGLCCITLVWWLHITPSNNADWRDDVTRAAWISFNGDQATIHNFRDCHYQTETTYADCWTDKTVLLSQLKGADFFFTNWGPRWIGHPIISFQFGDKDHIAFSIEARYKKGQSYSAVLGFFRQYELIFLAANERDVIRLRTNYRKGEEVYLYRTSVPPDSAKKIFLSYATYLNQLRDRPEWYNALTKNCTTTLDSQIAADVPDPKPWSYQLIVNGSLDGLLYARGRLVTGGLPFEQLREREHIDDAARAADQSTDFSTLIRAGRIGF